MCKKKKPNDITETQEENPLPPNKVKALEAANTQAHALGRWNKRRLLDITNTQPDKEKKRKITYHKSPLLGRLSLMPDLLLHNVVGEYLKAEDVKMLMAVSKTFTKASRPMVRSVKTKNLSCAFSFLAALTFLPGLRTLALENCHLGSKQIRMLATGPSVHRAMIPLSLYFLWLIRLLIKSSCCPRPLS